MMPTSGCCRGCLPRAVPRVAPAVHLARIVGLVLVLLAGIAVAAAVPLLGATGRARATRGWFRAVVWASGVRLVADQSTLSAPARRLAGRGTLVASNHVSWLDIPAVLAVEPMRVLAKSDVRGWPVIGLLAALGGTLFIDRRRLRRLPATIAELAATLRDGHSVLVFPEGSTWCGRTSGRYYPATFQAAVDAGTPVRPVSLHYRLDDGSQTTAAAFVGDDTLLASVWRVTGTRGLTVELRSGPALPTTDRTRRDLARAASASPTATGPTATSPTSTNTTSTSTTSGAPARTPVLAGQPALN
jgi:1-acyl-sn-glycerol-3-phosphate acyltransferase